MKFFWFFNHFFLFLFIWLFYYTFTINVKYVWVLGFHSDPLITPRHKTTIFWKKKFQLFFKEYGRNFLCYLLSFLNSQGTKLTLIKVSEFLNSFRLHFDLIVPTFDTKVTEYLCSGWVFFSSDFLTSHFFAEFFISFERYCCPELKNEKIFHLWLLYVRLWGFKDCHFGQFGTINARHISRY